MTPLEIAALAGTFLGGVVSTLAVVRLRGKAPVDGSRLRDVKSPKPTVKP